MPQIPATLIPGDGIGPEIMASVRTIFAALGDPFAWDEQPAGLGAVATHGDPLPKSTLDSIRQTKLALKGPLTRPLVAASRVLTSSYAKNLSCTPTSAPPPQ